VTDGAFKMHHLDSPILKQDSPLLLIQNLAAVTDLILDILTIPIPGMATELELDTERPTIRPMRQVIAGFIRIIIAPDIALQFSHPSGEFR
jgi:hypothetical protein